MLPIADVVVLPIPDTADEAVEAAVHDFPDVDATIPHSRASPFLPPDAGVVSVVQEEVFGNLLMPVSKRWCMVPQSFCRKLVMLHYRVYRIFANRHRVGCLGHSFCIPCLGLVFISVRPCNQVVMVYDDGKQEVCDRDTHLLQK